MQLVLATIFKVGEKLLIWHQNNNHSLTRSMMEIS